jgi:hypothetical protein
MDQEFAAQWVKRPAASWAEPGSAYDDSARATVRKATWTYLVLMVLGFAAVVVSIVLINIVDNRQTALEQHGARVPGVVIGMRGQGENGAIRVAFAWNGIGRETVVHLDGGSPQYRLQESVTVLVDPHNPHHVSLPGETNTAPVTTLAMLLLMVWGAMLGVAAVFVLFATRRRRAVLRGHVWQHGVAYARVEGKGRGRRWRLYVSQADGPHALRILGKINGRRAAALSSGSLDVAGDVEKLVYVRAPGSPILIAARPPRRSKKQRRSVPLPPPTFAGGAAN